MSMKNAGWAMSGLINITRHQIENRDRRRILIMNKERPKSIFHDKILGGKAVWILGLLPLIISCVTSGETIKGGSTDRIMAEHSQMRRRLPLIERENDVLKQENLLFKTKVQQLTAKNEKLESDLDTMNDIYERDMAFSEELIQNLQKKYEIFTAESTRQVETLNQRLDELELKRTQEIETLNDQIESQQAKYKKDMLQNKAQLQKIQEKYDVLVMESTRKIEDITKGYNELEEKRSRELKALNDQIAVQQTTFNKERDELKQNHALKEYDLSTKINKLEKTVDHQETQIDTLKATNSEISEKLNKVLRQLKQVKSERDQIEKRLESKKTALGELSEKNKNALNDPNSKKQVD